MVDNAANLMKEIECMNGGVGYDAVIVCTSTPQQVRTFNGDRKSALCILGLGF